MSTTNGVIDWSKQLLKKSVIVNYVRQAQLFNSCIEGQDLKYYVYISMRHCHLVRDISEIRNKIENIWN